MIPDTPNDFLNPSLPQDLEALYNWAAIIGDEAYNTMNVASELNLGNPEDFQTIVDGMDDMKNKLASLKNLADKIHHNLEDNEDEQEESK